MPRGKATVQRYNHSRRDTARILERRSGAVALTAVNTPACSCDAPAPEKELPEHIVDQLRVAYDELLSAPVPDHLQKLLANLIDQEGKS